MEQDIKFLKEWLNMPEGDYRNNILVVKRKIEKILKAIRT